MIFYIVSGEVYRSKGNTDNPIEIHEEFRDVEPIVAREKAFSYYQNYIDVFLKAKRKYIFPTNKLKTIYRSFSTHFKKNILFLEK